MGFTFSGSTSKMTDKYLQIFSQLEKNKNKTKSKECLNLVRVLSPSVLLVKVKLPLN